MTAAIGVLAAGCSTLKQATSDAAPAPQAAQAPAPAPVAPPAPAPAPVPTGLNYQELGTLLASGNERAVKQKVVGESVVLNLARARGKNAPAGTYTAAASDPVFFRCRAVAGGFTGGEVSTKVADYRFATQAKQKIVDLERCEVAPVKTVAAPAPAPVAAPAPAPAAPAPAARAGGPAKAGMDAQGNVVDSSKVEAGSGRTVKGVNDFEGEITGNPAANSKFAKLQIGMPMKQVTDLAGPPTDQGAYMTGKAWIPFYFGGDRHRYEMTYKGQGRLIFAGGGMGDFTSGNLIWIIHNANESGYR
jgi:hypothetical protein